MARYRVAHLGLGHRGTVHADTFLALADRYEIVGLCELREDRLGEYAGEKGLSEDILFTDAERMLAETRPDLFCSITQPTAPRLGFVEMAARHGVGMLALEKPMATSLQEAWSIIRLCRERGIRGAVCHQHKYLTSMQKLKEIVASGDIGEVLLITASCQAGLMQLGTHFVDYILWLNGGSRAQWVVGHVHGRGLLADSHPSADYTMGQMEFANGVRAICEFGRLSASHMGTDKYWVNNRLTAHGTHGYAWAETDGRWGAFTRSSHGETIGEQGDDWSTQANTRLQPLYLGELADWLDGRVENHSCNLEQAYHGYEIMEALCISAMDRVRVELPLDAEERAGEEMFDRMRRELPECPERPQT